MRLLVTALAVAALAVPSATGGAVGANRVAYVHGGDLIVLDVATRTPTVVLRGAPLGPLAWSGDGRLVSDAGRIAGRHALPTSRIAWAPTGETAAYLTPTGAVALWTPKATSIILRSPWGAHSLAWGANGQLAIGRTQSVPGGPFRHQEVWVWRSDGKLTRVAGPLAGDATPIVEGFAPDGRALWWSDRYDSGSIAADGLTLYAGRTAIGKTLVFPEYVVTCGAHLAFVQGGDRFATHGKSIVFDGRDVSADPTRSWVTPSCSANGSTLVAAAGLDGEDPRIGSGVQRAIWQLLPSRAQLTAPPAGWTDEDPHLLADGSILFVRTHRTAQSVAGRWTATQEGTLELLTGGEVTPLADVTTPTFPDDGRAWDPNYYGRYGWPEIVAVAP